MQQNILPYWHFDDATPNEVLAEQYGVVHGSSLRGILDTPNNARTWRELVIPTFSLENLQWNVDVHNAYLCWKRINTVNERINARGT